MSPRTSLAARVSFASLVSAALAAAIASIVACAFAEALLTLSLIHISEPTRPY